MKAPLKDRLTSAGDKRRGRKQGEQIRETIGERRGESGESDKM
jgi:hypothetical protein